MVVLLAVESYLVVPRLTSYLIKIDFASATGLYVGDDIRVLGVSVGTITKITSYPDHVTVSARIDKTVSLPGEAKAAVLSQSLVSGRFVQISPVYSAGLKMKANQLIPLKRTAVPVNWKEVEAQLQRVSAELGPQAEGSETTGPAGELVTQTANNLRGQGNSMRNTLEYFSKAMQAIATGRTDLFGTIRNLQIFVSALAQSDAQIVSFNTRMASVSEILANNREDLASALTSLDASLHEVKDFVQTNRAAVTKSVVTLSSVLEELAARRDDIAQILHIIPTALSNLDNIYQPAHNSITSAIALSNFANPLQFICSSLAAAQKTSVEQGAKLCVKYLGPLLKMLTMEYPPIMTNPARGVGALPGQLVYSEPWLQKGIVSSKSSGSGPKPYRPKDLGSMLGGKK